MKLIKHSNFKITIIATFIIFNLILLIWLLQSESKLHTNADRSNILSVEEESTNWYQPKEIWTIETKVDSLLLADLQKDYRAFWFEKFKSEKLKDSTQVSKLIDFQNMSFLSLWYDENNENNFQTESYMYAHKPTLKYFSKDGHFAVIEDSAMEFIENTYFDEELINKRNLIKNSKSIWLLNNGTWVCRQLEIENSEIENNTDRLVNNNESINFEVKGTNYYPQKQAWNQMWTNYDETTIQKDLELMLNSGLNTVRVFLPYEEIGGDHLKPEFLQNFKNFLDRCESLKLKVIPTLFDFYGGYSLENYTLADRHLEQILTPFATHPAILTWDLKNEADLDFKNYGKETVLEWAEFMLKRARSYAPNQKFTIGWSSPKVASKMQNQLDIISFHYYEKPSEFEEYYTTLKKEIKSKPIMVTEFGQSSYESSWYPFSKNENAQLYYYQKIFKAFKNAGMKHFVHWTLYDFESIPDKVVGTAPWRKEIQKEYGFINQDGTKKPSFQVIAGLNSKVDSPNKWARLSLFEFILIGLIVPFVLVFIHFDKKRHWTSQIRNNFIKNQK